MRGVAFLLVGLLSGCTGNAEQLSDLFREFAQACKGTTTAELHFGTYYRYVDLKCSDFHITEIKGIKHE